MIETKICEPVNDSDIFEVVPLVKKYRETCRLFNHVENGAIIKLSCCGYKVGVYDTTFENDIKEWLIGKLKKIEKQLNAFGYTMEDEPKEIKVHVNRLKG